MFVAHKVKDSNQQTLKTCGFFTKFKKNKLWSLFPDGKECQLDNQANYIQINVHSTTQHNAIKWLNQKFVGMPLMGGGA